MDSWVAATSRENRAVSARSFLRAETRESMKLPVAASGPSAAKTNAKVDPVMSQIANEATIGTVAATIGNLKGAAGCGAVGKVIRGPVARESVTH